MERLEKGQMRNKGPKKIGTYSALNVFLKKRKNITLVMIVCNFWISQTVN